MRGRSYRRYQREKHIKRKEHILKMHRPDNMPSYYDSSDLWAAEWNNLSIGNCHPYWYVKHKGQLSKGKIHCSCPLCRCKTKNRGRRRKGSIAPAYNPSYSDRKKNESMINELSNYRI